MQNHNPLGVAVNGPSILSKLPLDFPTASGSTMATIIGQSQLSSTARRQENALTVEIQGEKLKQKNQVNWLEEEEGIPKHIPEKRKD